jgi:glycosyltransferase involved in cell wall biosynthesis
MSTRREPSGPAPTRGGHPRAHGAAPARFALLTREYATEHTLGGGLGAYVQRMTRALVAQGHEVEVFTTGGDATSREERDGAVLHRVPGALSLCWVRALLRLCRTPALRRAALPLIAGVDAFRLARALAARERARPFDAVQSSEFRATGLFVPGRARRGRPHLVRASSDETELTARNGGDVRARAWLDALQRRCLRRADVAYAPSRFLAEHYAARHGIRLRVLRPPAFADPVPGPPPEEALPKRYFVHFGQLTPAKGTPDLAAALPRVWEQAPDFEMVWAGSDRAGRLPGWRALWGPRCRQVHWLGPLPRSTLLAVVAAAEAAVLPSRFDNLPNTVIECLELGVPVIGTDGASVDELVGPGRGGALVPVGDPEALAAAIVRRWRSGAPCARAELPAELDPAAAVEGLLALAGLWDGSGAQRRR